MVVICGRDTTRTFRFRLLHGPALIGASAFLLLLSLSAAAAAQGTDKPTFWERFTLDASYEPSVVRWLRPVDVHMRDPASGREVVAFMLVRYRSVSHGMGLDAGFRLKPWLGVGLDAHLQRDVTPMTHDWFNGLGIRYGMRRALTLGAFVEFQPWRRDYLPRRGPFFRTGVRNVWFDDELHRDNSEIISPTTGRGKDTQGWIGGGYRLRLDSSFSLHVMVDLATGIDTFEGRLKIGGGYR